MGLEVNNLIEVLRLKEQEKLSSRAIARKVGCSKTAINNFLNKKTHHEFWENHEKKPIASGTIKAPHVNRGKFDNKVLVFTTAQNNTYIHSKFLKSLENYCDYKNARLVVGTTSYNKAGFQNGFKGKQEQWYDPKIEKYIVDQSMYVTEDLIWCGEMDISPTAVNPMSGMHSYTMGASGIFPHTKVQLESVPTSKNTPPKILYTTGSITQRNYIQKKTGQKASFHHVFAALVVEIDENGDWFARQLIAESATGCFYDLDKYFTPEEVLDSEGVEAINWGDIHEAKVSHEVAEISWGAKKTETIWEKYYENSILDILKPKHQFLHDVFDHKHRNHHNINDPYFTFRMFVEETESVEAEVRATASLIRSMDRPFCNTVVVESNHDLALQRWLKEADYKKDPVNAVFFLEMQLATFKAIKEGIQNFSIFEYASKACVDGLDRVKWLTTDESYLICNDIECGSHGHNGNNGARGSTRAYQIMGLRYNIGHQHSAGIKDGVYVAGVSGELDMGYNVGGSGWSHSHIITYRNGKRAIITLKNSKWRG